MNRVLASWLLAAMVAGTAAVALDRRDDDGASAVDASEDAEATSADAPATEDASSVTSAKDRKRAIRAKRKASEIANDTGAAETADSRASATSWEEAPAADASSCPSTSRGIVVDRLWQRAWLCADGAVTEVIPITSAANQPDPGTYPVYAMDYQSYSTYGPAPSTLDRFIAFTYGKFEGARIGFHAVPYYADGSHMQPLESVGDLAQFGGSSGCIRVLPEHAELLYGYLQVGDEVAVIS